MPRPPRRPHRDGLHVAARPVRGHRVPRCAARRAGSRCARAGCARFRRRRAFDALPTSASGAPGSAAVRMASRAVARIAGERQRCAGEKALDDAILERMEADHGEPPSGSAGAAPGAAGPTSPQTTPGSRKSEGPGTSAWPDPDPNHPACARRWLRPRSSRVAACVRWVGARAPPQLLLQSIEQTVLHHSRG